MTLMTSFTCDPHRVGYLRQISSRGPSPHQAGMSRPVLRVHADGRSGPVHSKINNSSQRSWVLCLSHTPCGQAQAFGSSLWVPFLVVGEERAGFLTPCPDW